jgi:broad specificity phosphatase PhoE
VIELHGNTLMGFRHGHSLGNEQGLVISDLVVGKHQYGLSATGRDQVQSSSLESLANRSVVLISSPFLRTLESAEILRTRLRLEAITQDERLCERHCGDLEGLGDYHYDPVWAKDRVDPGHTAWQVESVLGVWTRVQSFVQDCVKSYSDTILVFVAHGDVLSIACCGLRGDDFRRHRDDHAFHTAELRRLDAD